MGPPASWPSATGPVGRLSTPSLVGSRTCGALRELRSSSSRRTRRTWSMSPGSRGPRSRDSPNPWERRGSRPRRNRAKTSRNYSGSSRNGSLQPSWPGILERARTSRRRCARRSFRAVDRRTANTPPRAPVPRTGILDPTSQIAFRHLFCVRAFGVLDRGPTAYAEDNQQALFLPAIGLPMDGPRRNLDEVTGSRLKDVPTPGSALDSRVARSDVDVRRVISMVVPAGHRVGLHRRDPDPHTLRRERLPPGQTWRLGCVRQLRCPNEFYFGQPIPPTEVPMEYISLS